MLNPYALLIAAAVWLSSLAAVGVWQNHTGRAVEREQWQAREIATVNDAKSAILKLETSAREAEHAHALELSAIAGNYEKDKTDAITKRDSIIAGLRAGSVRLRDPYATPVQSCSGSTAPASATTGERNGAPGGELSNQTSEFLVAEASRADEIVQQLKACQAVILSDRNLQGPTP